MIKQNHEFLVDLRTLATDITTSLKVLRVAFSKLELADAKETARQLLKVVVEASTYVKDFAKKGDNYRAGRAEKIIDRTKQFVATQFRKPLDDFQEQMKERRLDFREAMLVQNLVNIRILSA